MPRGSAAEVGTERKSPNGYLYRKTKNDGWQLVHRLVAEEKLGRRLYANEYATFADGDRTNLDPKNIIIRLRGRSSLRRRLAVIDDHIRELQAAKEEIIRRLQLQENLSTD
jgi:hypothetical protein